MLDKKTVLILGAGSSAEFDLPPGDELARRIAGACDFFFEFGQLDPGRGDPDLYEAVTKRHAGANQTLQAGRRIAEGLPLARSIDDFLHNHRDDRCIVDTGKAAIAVTILDAEMGSELIGLSSFDSRERMKAMGRLKQTWLAKLFSFLTRDVPRGREELVFQNLAIINFNYDRCVEFFLHQLLQSYYGLSDPEAAKAMRALDIVHPYGKVGDLPWEGRASGPSTIPFGQRPTGDQLLTLADQTRTYTEQLRDEEEINTWRNSIAEAQQVVFLGFAFHQQNMDLLKLLATPPRIPKIYATSYGSSLQDEVVYRDRIRAIFRLLPEALYAANARVPLVIDFEASRCSDMLSHYGLSIAG